MHVQICIANKAAKWPNSWNEMEGSNKDKKKTKKRKAPGDDSAKTSASSAKKRTIAELEEE